MPPGQTSDKSFIYVKTEDRHRLPTTIKNSLLFSTYLIVN